MALRAMKKGMQGLTLRDHIANNELCRTKVNNTVEKIANLK